MISAEFHEYFSGKTALVTGGFGFIGSNLVRCLVNMNVKVDVIDSLLPQTGSNLFNLADVQDRIHFVKSDIRNITEMKHLLKGKNFLFNMAGLSSHTGGMRDPIQDLETNTLAQLHLLESCREVNPDIRIVFAGTRQVYGRVNHLPVDEDTNATPVDYNGVSKLAGELYHIVCNQVYGLWTTSIRMTNTYGPRMRVKDANQTFIGLWIRNIVEEKPIEVFGTGEQLRDLNHITDVINAILLCVINPISQGKIYNLGADPIRLIDLAEMLIALNKRGTYFLKPFPPERLKIDMKDYAGDYSKINRELNWKPKIQLDEGLQETLEFYRSNESHYW
jgi:UDP-glucose 4-epimerase